MVDQPFALDEVLVPLVATVEEQTVHGLDRVLTIFLVVQIERENRKIRFPFGIGSHAEIECLGVTGRAVDPPRRQIVAEGRAEGDRAPVVGDDLDVR